MCFTGIVPAGLTLWTSVRVQVSPDGGILAEFVRELEQINRQVNGIEFRLRRETLENIRNSQVPVNR